MASFPHDARRDVLEHSVARFTERHEELALALCIEAGKPIRDARGEVTRLIDTFRIAAGEATRLGGEVIDMEISRRTRGYRGMAKRAPIGPCALDRKSAVQGKSGSVRVDLGGRRRIQKN